MINVDDRILNKTLVDANEYWLLCHIAKRLNKNRICWPSNKMLCMDTGWSMEKLQKVKKKLVDKGFVKVIERHNKGTGQTTNAYKVVTSLIGIYINLEDLEPMAENTPTPENQVPGTPIGKTVKPIPENQATEVLTSEVLTNTSSKDDSPNVALNTTDGNVDVFGNIIGQPIPDSNKTQKQVVAKNELYARCVDFWLKEFHVGWAFGAVQGKALKSLIKKIHAYCLHKGLNGSDECVLENFRIFCKRLPDWFQNKDLQILDSKFNEIVSQEEQGGQAKGFNSVNSSSRLFGKYGDYGR